MNQELSEMFLNALYNAEQTQSIQMIIAVENALKRINGGNQ